ncbi:hypothetical protein FHS19_004574 [Paenibacillus rhizosphaerae]|uniref:Uncharacterized protein n=1 Tax=Paenibacillus rhizosphaerae TaxID=297318 RepID=A0A839TX75_9BACL|nr:hypothetical protein [Paenibacillus rhizosphaerae]MBB3129869.1 hypothetical protein [Paenibacillus rhizosphaerae]
MTGCSADNTPIRDDSNAVRNMPIVMPSSPKLLRISFPGKRAVQANPAITRGSREKYLGKFAWSSQLSGLTKRASPARNTWSATETVNSHASAMKQIRAIRR